MRAAPDHNRGYKYPGGGLARQGVTAAPAEGQETQWPRTFEEALAYPGTSNLPYEPGDVLAEEPWRATRAAAADGLGVPVPPPQKQPDLRTIGALGPCGVALPGYGITAVATDGAANVHCTNPAPSATPPGAMSISEALKTGHRTEYVGAIGAECLWDPANFDDGVPAMVRVPVSEVPPGAPVCNTISVNLQKRGSGKFKSRTVLDESRTSQGRQPENSSPACLTSTLLLMLSIACQMAWTITQFDVTTAYLLAAPIRLQFARFPRGWKA
jgi:hypothetical protein